MTKKKTNLPGPGSGLTGKAEKPRAESVESTKENNYATFLQSLEVIGIALKSSASKIDRDAYFDIKQPVRMFQQEYELLSVGKNYFDVEARYTVTAAASTEAAPVLTVNCVFVTHIHGTSPISRQNAERFAKSELRLILVPFARQFVSNMSAQMAIPPVIVPLSKRLGT